VPVFSGKKRGIKKPLRGGEGFVKPALADAYRKRPPDMSPIGFMVLATAGRADAKCMVMTIAEPTGMARGAIIWRIGYLYRDMWFFGESC